MNRTYIYLLPLLLVLAGLLGACAPVGSNAEADRRIRALYDSVDAEMARSESYRVEKERRIALFRDEMMHESDPGRRLRLSWKLIGEFESYVSDSALHYVNSALASPYVASRPGLRDALLIRKADISSHAGLFSDALAILGSIHPAELDSAELVDYYSTYCGVYQYQSEYAQEGEYKDDYERKRELYTDSLLSVVSPESFIGIVNRAPAMAREGRTDEALRLLHTRLADYEPGSRSYSILASILAYIYKTMGDTENYRRYLVLSTVSDLRGVVKENMAIRELATLNFEEGDLERANRYLKQSFADANFFAARMRNAQSSRMLPVIDDAYSARQARLLQLQRILFAAVSILAVVLIAAIALVLKQMRRAQRANEEVRKANEELSALSAQLREANAELAGSNERLLASDTIKEEYAGRFMEYCSSTLSTLQQYHQGLRVLATQGNRSALVKKLESSEMIDRALKDFYRSFDEAILEIYPSFVEKFNALLHPDEGVALRAGELLNTELRVFALMRIGIDDSEKIARFLRCSITTVYTYRSKIRRRALRPDSFESEVKMI
ncbi:MAG: hypothetical protein K2M06_09475 [Muribaculaceae bacterium]|nr:hypothetical protein [Muribaculaceae bacterium]